MIDLTNLSGTAFTLNADLIETIENIPETKITLTNGRYYLVNESRRAVVDQVIDYRRRIFLGVLEAGKPGVPGNKAEPESEEKS